MTIYWQLIGGMILSPSWGILGEDFIGAETFKLEFNAPFGPRGTVLISQAWFDVEELMPPIKVFADHPRQIVTLLIPPEFKADGLLTRRLAAKMSGYSYLEDNRVSMKIWAATFEPSP